MAENGQNSVAQSRSSKFLKDIGIYAIGNLGSKVITFFMVPLYTFFIDKTEDFGYYDVCLTVIFLLMPFVTLQLRDGAFRFLLDTKDTTQRQRIVTLVYRTLFASMLLSVVVTLAIATFFEVPHLWLILALLVAMSLQEVVSQVFRGLGDNKAFVLVGILSAFGIGIFSLIFVAWLDMGVTGIFIANIVARLVAIALVEMKVKTFSKFFRMKISVKAVSKDIFKYTLPLLPGAVCWWLTGSSDRWFIEEYLGWDINGLYAVPLRFVSILQTLATIFYQAWQETAILQYDSPDRNSFFTKIFNCYIFLLCGILIGFCYMLKLCYGMIVGPNYQSSILYLYPMAISTTIFAISAFFDMGYQCAKNTVRTLPAIVLSAVVNIGLNFLLVPRYGVSGVIATSIVTYLVLVTYRWFDIKRFFTLKIEIGTLFPIALVLVNTVLFYVTTALWQDAACMVLSLILLVVFSPKTVKTEIFDKIGNKIGRKA